MKKTFTAIINKLSLIVLSVFLKVFMVLLLGLFFTKGNIVAYTEFISRTSDISTYFLGFIIVSEITCMILIGSLSKVFFITSNSIMQYLTYIVLGLIILFGVDLIFIIEFKSKQVAHHFICGIFIATKYVLLYFIAISQTLKIGSLNKLEIDKAFLNYADYKFKKIINEKLFIKISNIIYSKWSSVVLILLLIYLNCVSLNLYENKFIVITTFLILTPLLFLVFTIQRHQVTILKKYYGKIVTLQNVKMVA